MRLITNHGSDRKYYYDSIGVNSRLDTLQAAVLDVKLSQLDAYNKRRREAADAYDRAFADLAGVTTPYRAPYAKHVFHQYTLIVKEGHRDLLRQHLSEQGIPTMIYYPVPLHLSAAYGAYGYDRGDFPVSEQLADTVLSLPMHSELDHEQLHHITQAVTGYFDL
jgi:dTDP-4-amino-4,6-dideoxygalactose transaminase